MLREKSNLQIFFDIFDKSWDQRESEREPLLLYPDINEDNLDNESDKLENGTNHLQLLIHNRDFTLFKVKLS